MRLKCYYLFFILLLCISLIEHGIIFFDRITKFNHGRDKLEYKEVINNNIHIKYRMKINPQYYNKKNDSKKDESNVVIGLLAIYNSIVVEPFFISLRKTGYKGEIICFTLDKSLHLYKRMFEKYNIHPIIFSKTYPYYKSDNKEYPISEEVLKKMSIIPQDVFFYANVRFFLLYFWLSQYSSSFDFILTSDIRDSIFQRNPFEWNYNKGIYLSHETQHCKYYESKRCSFANHNWFFNLNPPKHLLNNTFINAGQIFGSSVEMREFLKEYTELMYNIHLKNKRRVDTCDQGILNWYIYNKNEFIFPIYLFEAEHGYVRVLGLDLSRNRNDFHPNNNLTISNQDNTIPVIVHQYDVGLKYGSKERKRKYYEFLHKYINIS